jgi:hypothetical protein
LGFTVPPETLGFQEGSTLADRRSGERALIRIIGLYFVRMFAVEVELQPTSVREEAIIDTLLFWRRATASFNVYAGTR